MKKYFFNIIYSACFLSFFLFSNGLSYITHNGGNVSGTWTAGTTHYILTTVTVPNGSVLTIDSGVVVKFAANTELFVYGTLNAYGTQSANIVFTSANDNTYGEIISGSSGNPAKGDYYGICLYGASTYTGVGNFYYTRIRYGGNTSSSYDANIQFNKSDSGVFENSICEKSAYIGISIYTAYPTISSSVISDNNSHGIYVDGDYLDATAPTIVNNTFTNNNSYAAYICNAKLSSYSGNTGTGNKTNGLGVRGYVRSNISWSMGSSAFPFVITGTVVVEDNYTLELTEGTILKGLSDGEFQVYGTVDVNGTNSNNVVLTSIKDDSYGGDTNGDSNNTVPARGDWRGMAFYGSNNHLTGYDGYGFFDYCRIRYGGNTSTPYDANIYFSSSEWRTCYFRNCTCEYSGGYGIQIYNCTPVIEESNISYNNWHGIFSSNNYRPGNAPYIDNNIFNSNAWYPVFLSDVKINSYKGNRGTGNGVNGFAVFGNIMDSVKWEMGASDFPFVIVSALIVDNTKKLVLPPGTVIKLSSPGEIIVYGILEAVGEDTSNIVITSLKDDNYAGDTNGDGSATVPARGDWYGINLTAGSNNGIGHFSYCKVRYGGNLSTPYDANIYFSSGGWNGNYFNNSICEYSSKFGIVIYDEAVTFNNSIISNNSNTGVYASGSYRPNVAPYFINCTFNNNGSYAVYLNDVRITSYTGNSGTGNAINGFGISGQVTDDSIMWTMGSENFPFILGTVIINNNKKLVLPPGTVIKFLSMIELIVYGVLDAIGTISSNVIFTSLKDDSYGGDTNGDGTSSTPARGDWYGMNIIGGSYQGQGHFKFCKVRYGGNMSSSFDANIYFTSGGWSGNYFDSSTCEFSAGYGIRIYNETVSFNGSTFSDNNSHGIYAHTSYRPSTSPYISNCAFNSNGGFGAFLDNIRAGRYEGNTGVGNSVNELGLWGYCEDSHNWSSGSDTFPISLTYSLEIYSGKTITITSGVLRCGTNYIDGSGNFILNPGATLEIGSTAGITSSGSTGNIRNTGTRSFSTGANYVYNGSSAQVTGSGLPSTVNNLTINNSAGVSLSNPLLIKGILYLTSGILINTPNKVTVDTTGLIVRSGATLSQNAMFNFKAKVEYRNTSPITIGMELPATDLISTINLNTTSNVTLNRNIRVRDTLKLTRGYINTGSDTLEIGYGILTPGELIASGGWVTGNLKRWIPEVTKTTLFATGTTTKYLPAEVAYTIAPSTGGTLTCSYNSSVPGMNGFPLNDGGTEIVNMSNNGYWSFTPGDGLTGGTYNLFLTQQGFSGVKNYSTLRFVKRTGGGAWQLNGTYSAGTGRNDSSVIKRTGLTGFSDFVIAGGKDNPLSPKTFQLTALIEGLYNSITDRMISDTVVIVLRDTTTGLTKYDSVKTVLDTMGISPVIEVNNISNGDRCYISIRHRNGLETWSNITPEFTLNTLNYNFTTSSTQAYGSNMIQKGTKWCIYSGDVNQDGQISLDDLLAIDVDNQNFETGYRATDVNGDGQITLDDLLITDVNNQNFISVQKPGGKLKKNSNINKFLN